MHQNKNTLPKWLGWTISILGNAQRNISTPANGNTLPRVNGLKQHYSTTTWSWASYRTLKPQSKLANKFLLLWVVLQSDWRSLQNQGPTKNKILASILGDNHHRRVTIVIASIIRPSRPQSRYLDSEYQFLRNARKLKLVRGLPNKTRSITILL